jgi:Domain of unknown function (DUF4157)
MPLQGAVQAKLVIGPVNDPLEHEADHIADQVMRMPASPPSLVQLSPKRCTRDEAAQMLQTKAADLPKGRPRGESGMVQEVLRSPGAPLDGHARSFMEPRFGWDFGRVRVHVGSEAAHAATEMRAKAFTYGHHIVFGSGEYAPATVEGKRLLAHELAHVGQQQSDRILRQPQADPAPAQSPAAAVSAAVGVPTTGHLLRLGISLPANVEFARVPTSDPSRKNVIHTGADATQVIITLTSSGISISFAPELLVTNHTDSSIRGCPGRC